MSRSNAISPEVILRLRAAGIPMPGDDLDTQPDITINVDRAEITKAYDMRTGAEYMFGVTVTNRSYARLTLKKFNCEMDWESNLSWISDPRMYSPRRQVYHLKSGKTFYCARRSQPPGWRAWHDGDRRKLERHLACLRLDEANSRRIFAWLNKYRDESRSWINLAANILR
jgi:hypothetical protein